MVNTLLIGSMNIFRHDFFCHELLFSKEKNHYVLDFKFLDFSLYFNAWLSLII